MKNSIFDYFAELAESNLNYTQKSGRYIVQEKQERKIPPDIISKMQITKKDEFLEIGCGLGNLTIPILKHVKNITVIDHPTVIKVFKKRIKTKKISFLSGNFLNKKINKKFDKILIYGVVHCLKNEKELNKFILKATNLLKENGSLLIGDIPNIDKKKRFQKTTLGKKFEKNWKKIKKKELSYKLKEFQDLILINDKILINLVKKLRKKNFNIYILPQNKDLPFAHTREDILIRK